MATSLVRHRVADFDAFRKVYGSFGDAQREGGVIEESVHRLEEDPNTVLVLHRFARMDEAHAFFANAELKQAMQDAGVDMSTLRLEFYEDA